MDNSKNRLDLSSVDDTQPIETVSCDYCGKIHDVDGGTFIVYKNINDPRIAAICRSDPCMSKLFAFMGLIMIPWTEAARVARRKIEVMKHEFETS